MKTDGSALVRSILLARIALIGCGGVLAACIGEPPEDAGLATLAQESQCGPSWDVQDVERYDGTLGVTRAFVAKHERPVGYRVGGCTGTLISDDLFISAGHCPYAVNDVVRFDYQVDANGVARVPRDYLVTQVVEKELSSTYDYAIVRLADNPGREYGHAAIAAVDPPAGSRVAIIQHPASDRKKIHAGPVLDYSSPAGANWFRYQVDTTDGSSGSGVLNTDGQLVGIHSDGGCATSTPIAGNTALRMSRLVPHSPTLQALVRSRILWTESTSGKLSLWLLNADGSRRSYVDLGPFAGWTPISMANNRILWRHTSNMISLWRIDDNGNQVSYAEHGPFAGWIPVNYANNRILWRHTSGQVALWVVDDAGNHLSDVVHGPFAGWTPVNYANNRILWRHTSGQVALWVVDDAGNYVSDVASGPFGGWTPVSYDNGEILWRDAGGSTSQWQVDRLGNQLAYQENGPATGWTPLAWIDRKLLWVQSNGMISYWSVNGDGAYLSHYEHGPFGGWMPLLISGGRP